MHKKTKYISYLRANLIATLAHLQMYDFPHFLNYTIPLSLCYWLRLASQLAAEIAFVVLWREVVDSERGGCAPSCGDYSDYN
jgi:hypothetical protein